MEIKSGYGLDLDSERRLLGVARRIGEELPDGPFAIPGRAEDLAAFLTRVGREAQEGFGLSPPELAAALVPPGAPPPAAHPVAHVVECSERQCRDHAREIAGRIEDKARQGALRRMRSTVAPRRVATRPFPPPLPTLSELSAPPPAAAVAAAAATSGGA